MSKYQELFLSEAREHLKTMGELLIAQEQSPDDRQGIDSLFREAHSIKGMAASMGYLRTAGLAHHLEDSLDLCRKSGTVPPALSERLLAGLDLLEGLVDDVAGDRPERDTSSFLAESVSTPVPPETPPAAVPAPEPSPQPAAKGQEVEIEIELAENASVPAARALLVLRELKQQGELVSCLPSEERLRQGEAPRPLKVRLRTAEELDGLRVRLRAMADVARVAVGGAASSQAPPAAAPRRREERTVRVRTGLLDRFIDLTGELITNRYALQSAAAQELWPEVREGLDRLNRHIADLHHHVLQVRMLPLDSITGRLPRMVRDLARKTGKTVALRVEGDSIELDRTILEQLADPLMHLVRNAVDHGIEQSGVVTVRAWREKDLVGLEVADDGRGIDPAKIGSRAVARALVSEAQLKGLRERDILEFICYPGFSTAAAVTETSGRGVGMDVVKSAVENLGGTLEIVSAPGEGTRFLLKVPLSVAIIKALLVGVGGRQVGIPLTRILRTFELSRNEVERRGSSLSFRLRETVGDEVVEERVPLLSLRKMLRLPGAAPHGLIPVVLTEIHGRRVGLVVDRLAGQREIFVKALSFPLSELVGVNGATILGDGQVVFLIDPAAMLEMRPARRPAAARQGRES
jgi:two-component system chemotaxis sensor kinase CheA